MGLDFWGVKLKKNIKESDFKFKDPWTLIENKEVYEELDKDVADFILKANDRELYELSHDFVGYFPISDPISFNSKKQLDIFADKLNEAIKKNPTYEYMIDGFDYYTNEDVRKFIKYINFLRDNGWIIWCSQ